MPEDSKKQHKRVTFVTFSSKTYQLVESSKLLEEYFQKVPVATQKRQQKHSSLLKPKQFDINVFKNKK